MGDDYRLWKRFATTGRDVCIEILQRSVEQGYLHRRWRRYSTALLNQSVSKQWYELAIPNPFQNKNNYSTNRAQFFFISSIAACVTVSNLTFSFFRNKSNNPPHMPPSYTGYTPPPHMPSQQAHVSSYTSGHSRVETDNPFFSQAPHRSVFRDDQGPEGRPQRRLELGPPSGYASQDHLRTPSPIKQRKFM